MLNLTRATTFAEFVREIRCEGRSEILLMPRYRESFHLRVLDNVCDVFREYPDHGLGWRTWSDRVFYLSDDDRVRTLSELWGGRVPPAARPIVGLVRLLDRHRIHPTIRTALAGRAFSGRGEPAL
jgi:hypothetical protein